MIETLVGWLFLLQEPTLATTTCLNQANKQIKLKETGIIQLAPGCNLRMEERILPGAINHKGETEIIYFLLLHLNISELPSVLREFQEYMLVGKLMPDQMTETTSGDNVFKNNIRSLEQLEQQLYDLSLARKTRSRQTMMIHGSYVGLILLSAGRLMYFFHSKILETIFIYICTILSYIPSYFFC